MSEDGFTVIFHERTDGVVDKVITRDQLGRETTEDNWGISGDLLKKYYNTQNSHPYDELAVTKDPTGKVTTAQVVLDERFISAGVSVGQIFGSALGSALGGKDQLSKLVGSVAGGAVGALIGQKFAQVVATSLTTDLSKVSVADVFSGQNLNVSSAGIGAIASFLTAEIGSALHISGFGGQLFNAAANGFTVSVLTQVANKITAGLTFDAAIATIDWGGAVIGAANGVDLSIAGALGGYLGHELVPAQTHEGAVGGQLLGAVGSAIGVLIGGVGNFILPGIGSLIGTILGTLIGNHFGNTPHPAAIDLIDQAGYYYDSSHYQVSEGGSYDSPDQMARATDDIINAYLKVVNGAALDHSKQTWVGYVTDPNFRYVDGAVPAHRYYSFISPDDAVHRAALDVLQNLEVIGGDLLLKRAHHNSQSNVQDPEPEWNGLTAASGESGAEKLVIMGADVRVAQDYENYLNNREAINAVMAANPDSAFTAGWIATFARVNDLRLNHVGPSDFLGGLVGYLDSVSKAGLGAVAANASVRQGPGSGFTVEIGTANGIEVPGSLSVFADQVNVTSNAGGQTVQLVFNSPIAVGIHAVATGGSGGNDIWFGSAGAGASAGFNASASASAILIGSASNDTLTGSNGWDFIDGGAGNDTLSGGAGNDILRGGAGIDHLYGGVGNDTYLFNRGDGADTVYDDSGFDVLQFGVGITISDVSIRQSGNDLTVTVRDPANTDVAFDSLTDRITLYNGLDVANRIETFRFADGAALDPAAALRGGAAADYLPDGGTPRWLLGGRGDDTYNVSNVSDLITENAGEGIDTVQALISTTLAPNVEQLVLLQPAAAIDGTGNALDNLLIGNDAANKLYGLAGADRLYGCGGNDTLDGGAGADTMTGGGGDDTYVVDNANDGVAENPGEGNDTVLSSVSFTLTANVEYLTLTGAAIVGTGNALDNAIGGNGGDNTLYGLDGNDALYSGNGTDVLYGGAGNDGLYGQGGDDTLDGGPGADNMAGGTGDDLYIVDDANDAVTEADGQGNDTVQSSVSTWLAGNVEYLTLTGTAVLGGGNALDNSIGGNGGDNLLYGLEGNDALYSGNGNDVLYGGAGNDGLYGQGGNDTLDGGPGADNMAGGTGDDLYIVDDANDAVTEVDGQGNDTVQSSISYWLTGNVENLTLTGAAAIGGGNASDNSIGGNDGDNILYGLEGNDTLYSGNGNDSLVGGAGNDGLYGEAGNDILDGGPGADQLAGGTGDDLYVVDDAGDAVTEADGQGNDTVQSSINYWLTGNVEYLTLTGTAVLGGGNALDNAIGGNGGDNFLYGLGGSDWLYGQAGNDRLDGGTGADKMAGGTGDDTYVVDNADDIVYEFDSQGSDTVWSSITLTLGADLEALKLIDSSAIDGTGNALDNFISGNDAANTIAGMDGNDTLYGYGGDDTLDGGGGFDDMTGGFGNDIYYVDSASDAVTESGGGGYDTVRSSVSAGLADNVEMLELTGSSDITGSANDADNILVGNGGDNRLYGVAGNDSLYAQAGNDTLDGGTGADLMVGGTGDDFYIVDDANDAITEFAGGGNDTVRSSVSFTLAMNASMAASRNSCRRALLA
jgi:Ca2+-binding RTX toxin-like protein